MRVILFGATGMVGSGTLIECCDDPRVTSIISIVRRPSGRSHAKLREIVHSDFFAYDSIAADLTGADACFFCLGVSSAGMSEEKYTHLTYDLTMAAAHAIVAASPQTTFCYVSGRSTDSTEKGTSMWARVKGRTENAIMALPFHASYMFRPAAIQPKKGVRSKTPLYQAFYVVLGPVMGVLRHLAPRFVTSSDELGRAMINVAAKGYSNRILESDDINRAAAM